MIKKYKLFVFFGIILVGIGFLWMQRNTYEITPDTARNNKKAGHYDYIVDVRTHEEWDQGHLTDALSIPIGNFVSLLPEKIPNKDARILFVCKKGIRASGVITMAQKMGYSNVQAMIGNYSELQ